MELETGISIEKCLKNKDTIDLAEAENIQAILSQISPESSSKSEINRVLNELNDLIRTNEKVRENGLPARFYVLLKSILLEQLANYPDVFWPDFEILIKCLKNSGAAFKTDVNSDEMDMCKSLMKFVGDILEADDVYELNEKHSAGLKAKCVLFVMQYFFNLSQGNRNLLKHFLHEWTTLSFRLLQTTDISFSIFSVASMILVNSCIDKHNESLLIDLFKSTPPNDLIRILNKVFANLDYVKSKSRQDFIDIDQEELEYLIDESYTNWSFRLVDFLFDIENHLNSMLTQFATFDLIDRISVLKVLKMKLAKGQTDQVEFEMKQGQQNMGNFMTESFVYTVIELYNNASDFFIAYLLELAESPEFEVQKVNYSVLVHMHLTELKHLAYCLSDLLTLDHSSAAQASKLHAAQADQALLKQTCVIFQELHANQILKNLFEILESNELYSATHSNLKCELIRLIGILVFENNLNQNFVAENKVMDLIAKANLSMDVCNPFVREWSLLALKHILIANDTK